MTKQHDIGGGDNGDGSNLSGRARHILELTYATYRRSRRWPTMMELGYALVKEGLDVELEVGDVPETLLTRPQVYGDLGRSQLSLTLDGMCAIGQGRKDLELLARAIHICWKVAETAAPETGVGEGNVSVTSEHMLEGLHEAGLEIDQATLGHLGNLMMSRGGISRGGSFGNDPGSPWNVTLDLWEVLRRRGIKSLDDLLKFDAEEEGRRRTMLASIPKQPFPAAWLGGGEGQQALDEEPVHLIDGRYVFVLMPFKEVAPWSDEVYGWMIDAFRELANDYPGLNWHRADNNYMPGMVPNQIREEIRRAGIIVADLTDGNQNVFYEVGFAHGLGKEPILLNQSPTPYWPFDLRVDRQMQYKLANKYAFATDLKNYVRAQLGPADPPLREGPDQE